MTGDMLPLEVGRWKRAYHMLAMMVGGRSVKQNPNKKVDEMSTNPT